MTTTMTATELSLMMQWAYMDGVEDASETNFLGDGNSTLQVLKNLKALGKKKK